MAIGTAANAKAIAVTETTIPAFCTPGFRAATSPKTVVNARVESNAPSQAHSFARFDRGAICGPVTANALYVRRRAV